VTRGGLHRDTDRGAKIGLRWVMGPFEIMNKIGIAKAYSGSGGLP
jgi:hypothetical protein